MAAAQDVEDRPGRRPLQQAPRIRWVAAGHEHVQRARLLGRTNVARQGDGLQHLERRSLAAQHLHQTGHAVKAVPAGEHRVAHVALDEDHPQAGPCGGERQIPGHGAAALAARLRADGERGDRTTVDVAQVRVEDTESFGHGGGEQSERPPTVQFAGNGHRRQHRRAEHRHDVLAATEAPIGLLAHERETRAEDRTEDQAEDDRLQRVTRLPAGDEAALDQARRGVVAGGKELEPLEVGS
ncbi:hypothetical protein HRbin41_01088 [bacterium HR41]|nr:hypothetical protein HRbin41_01088 [bacterium HR41]